MIRFSKDNKLKVT